MLAAAERAQYELRQPASTVQVAGQDTAMRHDLPRGFGLLRAVGDEAGAWLAATLLAGNGVAVLDSPALDEAVRALHEEGVPAAVLRPERGDVGRFLQLAAQSGVDFAVCDRGPMRSLARALGPTEGPRQRGLKAMLTTLDGPKPGETGFLRRFAWSRVTAIRTLRHGADLRVRTNTNG